MTESNGFSKATLPMQGRLCTESLDKRKERQKRMLKQRQRVEALSPLKKQKRDKKRMLKQRQRVGKKRDKKKIPEQRQTRRRNYQISNQLNQCTVTQMPTCPKFLNLLRQLSLWSQHLNFYSKQKLEKMNSCQSICHHLVFTFHWKGCVTKLMCVCAVTGLSQEQVRSSGSAKKH